MDLSASGAEGARPPHQGPHRTTTPVSVRDRSPPPGTSSPQRIPASLFASVQTYAEMAISRPKTVTDRLAAVALRATGLQPKPSSRATVLDDDDSFTSGLISSSKGGNHPVRVSYMGSLPTQTLTPYGGADMLLKNLSDTNRARATAHTARNSSIFGQLKTSTAAAAGGIGVARTMS